MPTFDLLEQPWIPVLTKTSGQKLYSLKGIFEESEHITQLMGNPLEAAVCYRLLFAIAKSATDPRQPHEWLESWNDKEKFRISVLQYLQAQQTKFDLYDQKRPFLQNPNLSLGKRSPAELVYHRAKGNNPVFLDSSQTGDPRPINSGEAALGLLVLHAYGGSGTGGLNELNGSKKDTMYAGPLCARMIAVIEGSNLLETVLLNTVVGKQAGLPAWERPVCDVPKQTRSIGVCDIYTRPTRNIRLTPSQDGMQCVGVNIVMGEAVLQDEELRDDPLIPVYFARTDKKFKALRVHPGKALWRNANVLLAPNQTESRRSLYSVESIRGFVIDGEVDESLPARLRALGVAANAQGPVTDMWLDEALPLSLGLFSQDDAYPEIERALKAAEDVADKLSRKVRSFASRYLSNGGGSPDPKDVTKLTESLIGNGEEYWDAISPYGEQLALAPIEFSDWEARLDRTQADVYKRAVERLPLDSRRLRAQFASAS